MNDKGLTLYGSITGHHGRHQEDRHHLLIPTRLPDSRRLAQALLRSLKVRLAVDTVAAVVAWKIAEGGHWYNAGHHNQLNTSQPMPGPRTVDAHGVKIYKGWSQGLKATVTTITNGLYGPTLAALRDGHDGQAVAAAVAASSVGHAAVHGQETEETPMDDEPAREYGASRGQGGATPRRFRDALDRARASWGAADPDRQAGRAGCDLLPTGVLVPFFGRPHMVSHPQGQVTLRGKPVHAAVAILVLHYLERADGTRVTGEWRTFRELPDGLFYWPSFSTRAEGPIATTFGESNGVDALMTFGAAAAAAGGEELDLADASFAFAVLPRLPMAVLFWEGDEDFAAEARIVFDAAAGHYLPAEDLAGVGEVLARTLIRGPRAGRAPWLGSRA